MKKLDNASFRFWLIWGLILIGIVYGIHRYFEYRNHELDKRLEQIRH